MTIDSTSVATKVIGGTGVLCATITADAASIIGGRGDLYATIKGSGGDVQTGSGTSQVNYTGDGGVFATGSGTSTITYHGAGGLFYEADSRGTSIFNATGDGSEVFGGDCVTTTGDGVIVYTRAQVATVLPAGTLKTLFTNGISSFLPNATIAAALAATGDSILPDGITANSTGSSCGYSTCCSSQQSARVIHFNGDSGSVYTGDRITYVYLNGISTVSTRSDRAICRVPERLGQLHLWPAPGGGCSYYDGGCGVNTLDYQDASNVIVNLGYGLARNGLGGIDTIRNFTHVNAGAGRSSWPVMRAWCSTCTAPGPP